MKGWVQFWKWIAGIMEAGEYPGRASSTRFAGIISVPLVYFIVTRHSTDSTGNLTVDIWFGLLAFILICLGIKAIEKVFIKKYGNGNSNNGENGKK